METSGCGILAAIQTEKSFDGDFFRPLSARCNLTEVYREGKKNIDRMDFAAALIFNRIFRGYTLRVEFLMTAP